MQENKDLGTMAEKYKAEMMRIYNQKKPVTVPVKPENQVKYPTAQKTPEFKESVQEQVKIPEQTEVHDNYVSDPECVKEAPCKFPTAEELMKLDCGDCGGDGEAVQTMMHSSCGNVPDTHFDSGTNAHMQGNYEIYNEDEKSYENSFDEENCCADPEISGKGYIQAEVTNSADGSPIAGAAVAVLKKICGADVIAAMLVTDSHGMTEAVALPVTFSGENTKPYEEYMITVYKEGFYSVNMLSVPIFDTIKSIQPVEMTKADNEC